MSIQSVTLVSASLLSRSASRLCLSASLRLSSASLRSSSIRRLACDHRQTTNHSFTKKKNNNEIFASVSHDTTVMADRALITSSSLALTHSLYLSASVCLPLSVSVCLSVCLSLFLSICLSVSVCLSVCLCLCLSLSLSLSHTHDFHAWMAFWESLCPFVCNFRLSVSLQICLSFAHRSTALSQCMSIYAYVSVSVCLKRRAEMSCSYNICDLSPVWASKYTERKARVCRPM